MSTLTLDSLSFMQDVDNWSMYMVWIMMGGVLAMALLYSMTEMLGETVHKDQQQKQGYKDRSGNSSKNQETPDRLEGQRAQAEVSKGQ